MILGKAAFLVRMIPVVIRSAPAIAEMLFHKHAGDPDAANEELRFVRDHKREWKAAQPGFEERMRKLEQEDP